MGHSTGFFILRNELSFGSILQDDPKKQKCSHTPSGEWKTIRWMASAGRFFILCILQRILRTHSYFSTSPMFLFCCTIFIPTLRGETRGYIFFHEFYCLLLGERHKLFIQRFIGHQIDRSIELIL